MAHNGKNQSIEILMEEVKPIVIRKFEFEHPNKSIVISLCEFLRIKSKFWCKEKKSNILKWILRYKQKIFVWNLDEWREPQIFGEKWV